MVVTGLLVPVPVPVHDLSLWPEFAVALMVTFTPAFSQRRLGAMRVSLRVCQVWKVNGGDVPGANPDFVAVADQVYVLMSLLALNEHEAEPCELVVVVQTLLPSTVIVTVAPETASPLPVTVTVSFTVEPAFTLAPFFGLASVGFSCGIVTTTHFTTEPSVVVLT